MSCISHTAGVRKKGIPAKPGMWKGLDFFRSWGVKMAVAGSSGEASYSSEVAIIDYLQAA